MCKNNTAALICLVAIFLLVPDVVFAHANSESKPQQETQVLAPGYRPLNFEAPLSGSYILPIIAQAGDGSILTTQNKTANLHDYFGEKHVVLSFIYTHCDDVNGCPLATYVISQIQNKLINHESLQNQVRFISLSFDPENDTPKVMQRYSSSFIKDHSDWQFLTTSSTADLSHILKSYGQSVIRELKENGETSIMSHILRVYLIDKKKQIRNIYSTSFLHPDSVLNDIKTLSLETKTKHKPQIFVNIKNKSLHGSGDYKEGYESKDYQTQSLSLKSRRGNETNLLELIDPPTLGLPKLPSSLLESINEEKIKLGRELFYDRRLSHNNTISCAMCHVPEQGFTSQELATPVGIEGRAVKRNAPSLYNVAYAQLLFHDARENTLEQQIWSPLLAHNEMGNPSVGHIIKKIQSIPKYRDQFKAAFNGQEPDMKNIGEAIASYERTLVLANSDFDRWLYGNEPDAMTDDAKAGYRLFTGDAGCVSCHRIEQKHALFTDNKLHNTGVGYLNSMQDATLSQKVQLAPGIWKNIETRSFADASKPKPNDLGHYEITQNPDDRWKYKTPTLRNIALTSPYMHDGSLSSLREVVEFYNQGGIDNRLLDPLIRPLQLSEKEIEQLIAFLTALSGENIDEIISDAFAASVGNTP